MNILAIEASTQRLSVALWADGALAEKFDRVPNGGSERLLPWVNELLAESGRSLKQLDGIAFGAGPGGFTGLRLACGLAQGLAYGLDLPVVPVSTLAALAMSAGRQGRILATLDARMNEIYLAAYEVSGADVTESLAPQVGAASSLCLPEGAGWFGVGDGFAVAGAALTARMAGRLSGDDAGLFPTASAIALLAVPVLQRKEGRDAGQAVPIYVRDKVALTTAERFARGGTK